jgi:poly(hydroxyalkanoate) depolymerase family esterase
VSGGRPQRPLSYRLYVPRPIDLDGPPALLVALHGCTQTAADFAAGTRFDALADRYGLVVLYPEQSPLANPRRCWNWFLPDHQTRSAGEPASILELVDAIAMQNGVDRKRIFVCGLSAGAAMAAILAEQAPDIFAAVGIMSGVALHSSHDVESAYEAMRGERDYATIGKLIAAHPPASYQRLRVLIWTGEEDTTVAPTNAAVLAQQFRALGCARVELRTISGLGHAWSGGSLRGSHTAPGAPNASETMLEFFLASYSG